MHKAFDRIRQSEAETLAPVADALRKLDRLSILILVHRYVDAARLGITPADASRVKYRAIEALKRGKPRGEH